MQRLIINTRISSQLIVRLLPIFAIGALLSSCDRETDPVGPNLFDRFGPFEYVDSLKSTTDTVDFSLGESVSFSAGFNKNVPWVLTITGQLTGGKKIIRDFNPEVNALNSLWDGGTTELPLFKNEPCLVVLSVPEEPEFADTLMVEVTGVKENSQGGIVAVDFESPLINEIQLGDFEFELSQFSGRNSNIPAAQGDFFYRLEGTDNEDVTPTGLPGPTNNFFVGLANIFPQANGNPDLVYFELPTSVPEQLYLNMFINGRGTPFTRVVLGLIIDTNDSGGFEDGQDEILSIEFDPDYEGWRLQSFLVSDFGISQDQLNKLVGIQMVLISLNNIQPDPRQQVGFEMDYVIFTPQLPLSIE